MNSPHIADLESALENVAHLAATPDDQLQKLVVGVSSWSISQQLDHILKVAKSTLQVIVAGKALDNVKPINLKGRLVLAVGFIPRGFAKAPERLYGVATSSNELLALLEDVRALLERIGEPAFEAKEIAVVRHPIFRGLTPEQTLRFVVVHTRHHLKIVRDIARA